MEIKASIPREHFARIRYTLEVLAGAWLGLKIVSCPSHDSSTTLEISGKRLVFDDLFFARATDRDYLADGLAKTHSLDIPLQLHMNSPDGQIPLLFGRPEGNHILMDENSIRIRGDILGSAFFLLSGYESYLNPPHDHLGRLSAGHSRIGKFLHRPLANEYALLIHECLRRLDPAIPPRQGEFSIVPTHDVDHPYEFYRLSPLYFLKNAAGDVFLRKSFSLGRYTDYFRVNLGGMPDPFDTFAYMLNKEGSLQSVFYFHPRSRCSFHPDNPEYRLGEARIMRLLDDIRVQGKGIGAHFGIGTAFSPRKMAREARQFRQAAGQECIRSRQHFLSLKIPQTWRILEQEGVVEDSTFAFRDRPGFRAGACLPFPLFDYEQDRELTVWERPLVLMEGPLLDDPAHTPASICSVIDGLKRQVRRVQGEFVFLWHNHRLLTQDERQIYEHTLCG